MGNLLRLVVRELAPHRRFVLWLLVLTAIAAALEAVAPALLGKGIDAAVARSPWASVIGMIVGWCLLRALAEGLRRRIGRDGNMFATGIAERYTHRCVMELLDKPLGHHHGAKQREGAGLLMKFHWQLYNFLGIAVVDSVVSFVSLFAILAYVATFDPAVAGVLALTGAAYAFVTARVVPEQLKLAREMNRAFSAIGELQGDAVQNVQVVKSCAAEAFIDASVETKRIAYMEADLANTNAGIRLNTVQSGVSIVGTGAAILLGVLLLRDGSSSAGQISSVIAYAFAVIGFFRTFGQQTRMTLQASATLAELDAFMDAPPEDFVSGAPHALSGGVEFRNVRFRYRDEKPVLEDVSFIAPAGSRVAVVGRSGEGKTTMMDLLYRFYAPSAGDVLFDGVPAKEINLRSLRSQMAYVPQETTLFHDTLGANIRFGKPDATDDEVARAIRLANLDAFVAGLPEGLETIVGEKGLKLSGGQRQRVSLARAFLRDPKILVLDEPTSHQDAETEQGIQAALAELMRGRTMFVIAHRLRTVMDADLILVLDGGRIVERGTHAELAGKKDGVYLKLLKAQGMTTDGIVPSGADPRSLN